MVVIMWALVVVRVPMGVVMRGFPFGMLPLGARHALRCIAALLQILVPAGRLEPGLVHLHGQRVLLVARIELPQVCLPELDTVERLHPPRSLHF